MTGRKLSKVVGQRSWLVYTAYLLTWQPGIEREFRLGNGTDYEALGNFFT